MPPRISIVVTAYNGTATLDACLRALLHQELSAPFEIILVDDGSTDETLSIAERYMPMVKVLRQRHKGAAAGRNLGIASAVGEIVLFTDCDCEPVPMWASSLANAICQGADGAKGTYRTRQTSLTARFVQAEYEGKYRRMMRQHRIDFVDTYSAAYRRDILVGTGGFDEEIAAVEDQELSFRLAERGYQLSFAPEAVVYHNHADNPMAYIRKKYWIGYWKVRVAALHPDRIITDSHTPPSLKVQMLLLALALPCLALGFASRLARRGLLAVVITFLGTVLPLSLRVARHDPALAVATPFMMLLRAASLSWGFLVGLRSNGQQLLHDASYMALKRALDIVLAIVGLAVCSPLIAALAVAIKSTSRGPVLFVQWRVGRDGKPFRMYKLRSMVNGAEEMRAALVTSRRLHEPVLKIENDPRVTRVGRFMRRWSLDELPQLLNVLKGEMSLVGPRPEEVRVADCYSPWHRQRLKVKPGLTGPMQVNGRAALPLDERVRLELDYMRKASLGEDLRILMRTVGTILSGNGSY